MKKNILIYCHSYARLNEIILLEKELKTFYEITILIKNDSKSIQKLIQEDCKYLILTIRIPYLEYLLNHKYLNRIQLSTIGMLIHELLFEIRFYLEYKYIKKLLSNINYSLLITISDRHLNTLEYVLMKYTKNNNKKILIPFLYQTNPDGYISSISNNPKFNLLPNSSFYQKIIFNKYNKYTHNDTHAFLAFLYRLYNRHKVLTKNPWVLGAGLSDLTIVGNQYQYDSYKKFNPNGNYQIIGDISYKNIINKSNDFPFKQFLQSKYNLQNKQNIIYAVGQWFELKYCSIEEQYQIIEKNLNAIILYQKEFNILISLHPSMDRNHYIFLEKKYNVKILEEKLSDVIFLADYFICITSATIVWSTILGIKTLVLSDYKYSVDIYNYLETPLVYIKKENFTEKLHFFIYHYNPNFENDWKILSKNLVFNIDIGQRYYQSIEALLSSKNP